MTTINVGDGSGDTRHIRGWVVRSTLHNNDKGEIALMMVGTKPALWRWVIDDHATIFLTLFEAQVWLQRARAYVGDPNAHEILELSAEVKYG